MPSLKSAFFFEKNAHGCKFFLAKALAGVYIDRANTCFPNMNRTFLYLFLASVIGMLPVHAKGGAVEASHVHLLLNHKAADAVQPMAMGQPSSAFKDVYRGFKGGALSSLKDEDQPQWFVVNIPITIAARGKNTDGKYAPAAYISELTVKAYLLYLSPAGTSKKYSIVEKEITYVDIPLNTKSVSREGKHDVSITNFSVGLFVPRTTVYRMTGSDDVRDFSKGGNNSRIAGVAVEATYKGAPCVKIDISSGSYGAGATEFSKLYTSDLKKELGSNKWWKKPELFAAGDVKMLCISETPYAPFYSGYYPATKPMYGAPGTAAGSEAPSTDTQSSTKSTTDAPAVSGSLTTGL